MRRPDRRDQHIIDRAAVIGWVATSIGLYVAFWVTELHSPSWRVEVHVEPLPGDENLVDAAVVAGLRTGAKIHVLPRDALPATPLAGILRY